MQNEKMGFFAQTIDSLFIPRLKYILIPSKYHDNQHHDTDGKKTTIGFTLWCFLSHF